MGAALAELGLSVGQELILFQLWRQEGLHQTDLARSLNVEPPTITKALQRMERAGLVRREVDTADARISRVYLTADGLALKDPVEQVWERVEGQMLTGFTSEECMLLRRFLMGLRDNLS